MKPFIGPVTHGCFTDLKHQQACMTQSDPSASYLRLFRPFKSGDSSSNFTQNLVLV